MYFVQQFFWNYSFGTEVLEISNKAIREGSSYDFWILLQGIYVVNKERQHIISIIKIKQFLKRN